MLTRIRQFLTAPVFEDEEKTRISRLLNVVLLFLLAAVVVVVVGVFVLMGIPTTLAEGFTLIAGAVMALAVGVFLAIARRDRIRLASALLLSLLWFVMTVWVVTEAGVNSDSSMLSFAVVVVLAGLLLGGRWAVVFTVLSSLSMLAGYFLEDANRLIIAPRSLSLIDPFLIIVQLGFIGLLLRYAVNSMLEAMKRAQSNERAQVEANRELEALRASLEERVARRTRDLEQRSSQLQVAAEVSRAVISILETEQLIQEVANLLYERFALYHVSLFEVDSTGQWAEYRAGAGAGVGALKEEGFRLAVGGNSMVGWCTATAQARVSQDVGTDARHMDHPLVPQTRSEAALPLVARGQVIGALSAQSDRPDTFDETTISSMQIIADQVAVALDNARLFAESQQALEATRRAYGELTRQTWIDLLRRRDEWGYSYAYRAIAPAEGDWQPEMLQALETGRSVQGHSAGDQVLAMPLRVRDEVVGVLSFHKAESEDLAAGGGEWTKEEIGLLEQIIQQMGVALESAQFYEESQLRAIQERTAREVTARMRETLDIDAVLRTSLQEMRQALGLSSMTIRLAEPPDGAKGK